MWVRTVSGEISRSGAISIPVRPAARSLSTCFSSSVSGESRASLLGLVRAEYALRQTCKEGACSPCDAGSRCAQWTISF